MRNVDQLKFLFINVVVVGEKSWATSIGFVSNDGEGRPFNECASEDSNTYFQEKNDNIELNSFDEVENIETDIDNGIPIASKHDNGRKRKLPI